MNRCTPLMIKGISMSLMCLLKIDRLVELNLQVLLESCGLSKSDAVAQDFSASFSAKDAFNRKRSLLNHSEQAKWVASQYISRLIPQSISSFEPSTYLHSQFHKYLTKMEVSKPYDVL